MKKTIWKPQLPPFAANKSHVFSQVAHTGEFIYQLGESNSLRQSSSLLSSETILTREFRDKVVYLKSCFMKYREITGIGRGISAVQVGIPESFLLIYMPEQSKSQVIMINPQLTITSKKILRYPEICMSASPLIAPVIRPEWVEVTYTDEEGNKQYWSTKADTKEGRIYNRVIQHEIDHLNGIINIDRVKTSELIYAIDPTFYERASFKEVPQG